MYNIIWSTEFQHALSADFFLHLKEKTNAQAVKYEQKNKSAVKTPPTLTQVSKPAMHSY